jgi:hypothetical protein
MTRNWYFPALAMCVAGLVIACGLLAPANSPRADVFDCRQAALEPIFGRILDTKAFLRALYAGNADLGAALARVQATKAELMALEAAWAACEPPAVPPESDDGLENL